MRYKYKQVPLPNGKFDWIAVLLVQLSRGSKNSPLFEALIDSGASNCLFHGDIARAIGIPELASGEHIVTGGVVAGAQMDLYGHDVRLSVGSDTFRITGYFSDQLPIACLLGRDGFFDKYIVTFDPTEANPGFELTRVHKS